jgi:hypothetical protein
MKKALRQATVFVAAILAASACLAQTNRGDLVVEIPFPFVVTNRTLPPGRYIVTHMGESNLRIYNSQNQSTLVPTHTVEGKAPEGTGRMVFRRYGETYILSQVWFAANTTGWQAFRSRIEKEMARMGQATEVAVLRSFQ